MTASAAELGDLRALIESNAREAVDLVGELTLLMDRVDDENPDLAAARMAIRRIADRLGQGMTLERFQRPGGVRPDTWSPIEILEELEHEAVSLARSRIDVTVKTPDLVPQCWHFDRELVSMSLTNALHNALQHAMRAVTLELRLKNGCLGFSVSDDAGAFPADLMAAEASFCPRRGEINGNALGIHFARMVAGAHVNRGVCGWVELVNHRDRPGTCFTFWLP